MDPRKGERFLHDFTQTWLPHLCAASHDARNSSGGTYFSAECSLFLVVVPERLGYDGLGLLVVGKVVRPDVLALEGSVERLDVAVLLGGCGSG